MTVKKVKDDFNPKEAIKSVQDNLNSPTKFAKIFGNSYKQSKEMDKILKDAIKDVMKDEEMRKIFKSIFKEIVKNDWKFFIKKIWNNIKGISFYIAGIITMIILQIIVPKFLGKN